jgi:hypothetical protein
LNNAITLIFLTRVEHLAPKYRIYHYLLAQNFTNTFQCKNNASMHYMGFKVKKQGVLHLISKAKTKMLLFSLFSYKNIHQES